MSVIDSSIGNNLMMNKPDRKQQTTRAWQIHQQVDAGHLNPT